MHCFSYCYEANFCRNLHEKANAEAAGQEKAASEARLSKRASKASVEAYVAEAVPRIDTT